MNHTPYNLMILLKITVGTLVPELALPYNKVSNVQPGSQNIEIMR